MISQSILQLQVVPFDPTKKKKKKVVSIQDNNNNNNAVEDSIADQKTDHNMSISDGIGSNAFAGLRKKKKKKKSLEADTMINGQNADKIDGLDGDNYEDVVSNYHPINPWEGSDIEYEYEELLGRVFNILRENNPELARDRRRTVTRPPQVFREGTKKTVFANFMDLCRSMHRQPEHVMMFLLAEMGTSGSLDGQQG
ncbi:hypothetical protein RD792_013862 [Penstemon davidsonii]|uniref:Translation initiation factor IF2/IF5 domain-containing protein n=1 Tax=Penstemon davidsonii TaxID=160366 RepID=A0ABR0CMR3_9LAMI|nr:hypothetical protein RD792_013862 [Penstemon davidsonii]